MVNEFTGKPAILLVDDMASELDKKAITKVLNIFKILEAQIFLTFIEVNETYLSRDQEFKLFHVEHGIIRAVKNV